MIKIKIKTGDKKYEIKDNNILENIKSDNMLKLR